MKPINLNYNMMDMRRQYRTVQRHSHKILFQYFTREPSDPTSLYN